MSRRHGWRSLLAAVLLMLPGPSISFAGDWFAFWKPGPQATPAAPPAQRLGPRAEPLRPGSSYSGTAFGVQEYPWGYFGAKSCTTASYHRDYSGYGYEWSVRRSD